MFDFNDHYTLNELLAIDNFMCYVRAKAAESAEMWDLRHDLNKEHRALSRIINSKLDEAAEEWDAEHTSVQQARDHAAAEAEKVDRIKQACVAGAPPVEEPDDPYKWTSVKTQLPEERCAVLGYCSKSMCVYTVYRQGKDWMHFSEHTAPVFYPVTHWMPLPESPRSDSYDEGPTNELLF